MSLPVIDSFTFSHDGVDFRADVVFDEFADSPWDEHDCHGVVSDGVRRDKACSERVLCSDRSSYRFYDHRATVARFRKDFGCTGQQAHERALADFNRLRAWCDERWVYCGIVVVLLDDFGDTVEGFNESLWGMESDDDTGLRASAQDLAGEILARASRFETAGGAR